MARWLVSRFQGILFKWLVGGLTTEYRATFPTILIEVARWLVSGFQGILFKWLYYVVAPNPQSLRSLQYVQCNTTNFAVNRYLFFFLLTSVLF